jgi:hypothetical protein
MVVMVGSKKALKRGIKNDQRQKRYTYLEKRLKQIVFKKIT